MHTAGDIGRTCADNSPMQHTRSPPAQRRPELPMTWAQLLDVLEQTDTVIRDILVRDRLPTRVRADLYRIVREMSGPALGKVGRRAMVDPASRQLLGAKPRPPRNPLISDPDAILRPSPSPPRQLPIADEGRPEDIAEWVKRFRRYQPSVKRAAACSREAMIAALCEEMPEEVPVEVAEEADAPNLAELPSRPAAETLPDAPAE